MIKNRAIQEVLVFAMSDVTELPVRASILNRFISLGSTSIAVFVPEINLGGKCQRTVMGNAGIRWTW